MQYNLYVFLYVSYSMFCIALIFIEEHWSVIINFWGIIYIYTIIFLVPITTVTRLSTKWTWWTPKPQFNEYLCDWIVNIWYIWVFYTCMSFNSVSKQHEKQFLKNDLNARTEQKNPTMDTDEEERLIGEKQLSRVREIQSYDRYEALFNHLPWKLWRSELYNNLQSKLILCHFNCLLILLYGSIKNR